LIDPLVAGKTAATLRDAARYAARTALRPLAAAAALALLGAARAADVPDTMAQRLRACTACHGERGEGGGKDQYYPRLAGKPARYLDNQLRNFRDGRRRFPVMNYLIAPLSDDYLREIAGYFAAQEAPFAPPASRGTPAMRRRGEILVVDGDEARGLPPCSACHGKTLTGRQPAIPGLVGLFPDYVAAQIGAWKSDQRHAMEPDCMRTIAKRLVPDDVAAIGTWLAAVAAPSDPRPAPATSQRLPLECGGLDPAAP